MRSPALAASAAAVLALEGAALAVVAIAQLFGLGAGDAAILPTAIALIALTFVGAGALFAFAVGTRRGRAWARSGGVVLQVLAVVIALNSLTVQPVPWMFVWAVGLPGLIGFVLLIASARRETVADTRGARESAPEAPEGE
ncbi:MAG: hypothetical protein ACTH8F_02270 [Microbacterium sp.]|uniref:hypothetical protein n=1 Tax=Microbacterium sp. TaxID=51671 RepID=UPI003F94F050